MEGRGLSELYRNTSEDIFLRSYIENTVGLSVPTTSLDLLGFKNLSQSFRTDSEELFKSWLTNGENNSFNSPSIAHRTRQGSRRISTEITNLTAQQNVGINKRSNDNALPQNNTTIDDTSGHTSHHSIRNSVERGLQESELYLAKAWFHSSQPMTRSRSSELRRNYVAMHSTQTTAGLEAYPNRFVDTVNQEYAYPNGLNGSFMCEKPRQIETFISPSNSSSGGVEIDKVSSVVSMLKGTLERKKNLSSKIEKENLEDESLNGFFPFQEPMFNANFNQQIHETPLTFHEVVKDQNQGVMQMIDETMDRDMEGFVNSANVIQSGRVSQEPSQSESSAACDGPTNSGQAISVSESSKKQSRKSSENGSRAKDIRERIIGSLKDERKRGNLQRHGSVTSEISGDKEDVTKKRRVERSRKMAEAKERNSSPSIPSDMQSILKRCETLEKEVRSLKLNLSFMNRKDSEQTKQIEDLQKQNEELLDEKECLVEEINRILSETAKI